MNIDIVTKDESRTIQKRINGRTLRQSNRHTLDR